MERIRCPNPKCGRHILDIEGIHIKKCLTGINEQDIQEKHGISYILHIAVLY